MTRYIYLRSLPCQVKNDIYSAANLPVGCIAYQSVDDNTYAYGLSLFNRTVSKKEARVAADGRLLLALQGDERVYQQDRWGFVEVHGSNTNDKAADMIRSISSSARIHASEIVRERVILQLRSLINRLTDSLPEKRVA